MSNLNSNLNNISNINNMNALQEIKDLLKKDIDENGKKSYHPKRLLEGGFPTKKAMSYNRRLILDGQTTKVLDPRKVFNLDTGRFNNKPTDKRFKKTTFKQSAFKNKNIVDGTISKKKETKNYRYVMPVIDIPDTDTLWKSNYDDTLLSNDLLRNIVKQNKITGSYRLIITLNQKTIFDNVYNIKKFNTWWSENGNSFLVDSEYMIWNNQDQDKGEVVEEGDVVHFIFTKEKKLNKKHYEQTYLDAKVGHCVFTPILNWAKDQLEEVKSKSSAKRYNSIINKIENKKKICYLDKYSKGIPEIEIGEMCEDLQISIRIEQPFSKTSVFEYSSTKAPIKGFRFINTRLDHVEFVDNRFSNVNEKSCFKQYETETLNTRKELIHIKKALDALGSFYVYKKDKHGIIGIQTLEKNYQLYSHFNSTVNEFERENKLGYCAIDAKKYPDLMGFINDATHFNGTVDFIDTYKYKGSIPKKDIKHIDMTKAYTQSKKCKWYNGFMLKITDFRKTNKYYDNGLYYITNINFNSCDPKFLKLNEELGWFLNGNIYTSAELDALKSYGGTFSVKYGCWGLNDDFEFNEEMIDNVEEIIIDEFHSPIKVPYYSKWCGMNCMQNENKNIWLNGDQLYLANLHTDSDIYLSEDVKGKYEGRISYKKDKIINKKHITTQITAYQRLSMLDQLMQMNLDKLIRVCVDGIYYFDHDFKINDTFSKKEKMTFNNDPSEVYLSGLINNYDEIDWKCVAEPREHYLTEIFDGAGGDGKTYGNIIIEKGFIDVCYVPHSNRLATNFRNQYNKEVGDRRLCTSNHFRITNNPYAYTIKNGVGDEAYRHNVYIIDECSMLTEDIKDQMIEKTWGKIIFCGDLSAQIEPVGGVQMTYNNIDHVAKMSGKNYRFKTKLQLKTCNFLRDAIKNDYKIKFETLPYKVVSYEFVKNNYDHKKDMILVSRGATKNTGNTNYNNWWNDYLDDECKKYKVKNNTRDYKNGDIVFDDKISGVRSELRNGFTIHSIQGETYEGKIYIDMRKMQNLKMFYTAISRARTEDQIYLVK